MLGVAGLDTGSFPDTLFGLSGSISTILAENTTSTCAKTASWRNVYTWALRAVGRYWQGFRELPRMTEDKHETLRLVHFGRAFGRADGSPFCIKAEAYLRLLGLNYELVRGNPMKSPRGQLPVLLHRGETIAGSQEIIDYLRAEFGTHVDDWLSDEHEVQAYHLVKSVEEYLYFLILYQRWVLNENFKLVERAFFADMHPVLRFVISRLARQGSKKRVMAQGVGRYTEAEIDALAYRSVSMLSRSLGDRPYLFGDRPCWADCSVFGFVTNLLAPGFSQGAAIWIREFDNLVCYERRFAEAVFPDFVESL